MQKMICAEYTHANEQMREQLTKLWKICFDDTDEYIDLFFKYYFDTEHTHVMTVNGTVAGAIYSIPFKAGEKKGRYLYAGGVFPHLRGNGIYKKLIYTVTNNYDMSGVLTALLPALGLKEYYRNLGFDKPIYCENMEFDCGGGRALAVENISAEEYKLQRDCTFGSMKPYIEWGLSSIEYSILEARATGGFAHKIAGKGIIGYKSEDLLEIIETTVTPNEFKMLKDDIAATYGVSKICVPFPCQSGLKHKKLALLIHGDINVSDGWVAFTHE